MAVIRDFQPKTIIVEGIPLAALLKHLRPLAKLLILDMHNIESSLASNRPSRISRMGRLASFFKNDVARVRRLERRAVKAVDRIWVCSEPDRDRLVDRQPSDAPVYVVPNGIPRFDTPADRGVSQFHEGADGPVMLFVGHLGYWPNVGAVERLVRGIFPKVRAIFPSARVLLAGRHPNAVVKSIAALPGVELHANPGSLSMFYERAHIAVVPLSAGGGTRIKILEAVAWKLPVVATPGAVEGLGLAENEEVRLADSDEGLARHVIDLCKNPERVLRQTIFAEKTVKIRFSPETVDLAVRKGASLGQ